MSGMRFGCVWFDDFGTEGWASIAGDEAIRIRGTGDLASDVLWITSLDWKGMRSKSIDNSPRFRQNDFLRAKLSSIATELDMNNDGDVSERVRILSEITDRVCRLTRSIFGVTSFDKTLATTLRRVVLSERDSNTFGSPVVDYALKGAFQSFQRCEMMPTKGSNFYTWRFPRVDYAKYILDFPIPTSRWKKLDMAQFSDMEAVKEYLSANIDGKPSLCKIVIKNMNDDIFSKVMPFGYGRMNKEPRVWASIHETLHYMKYATVDVQTIIEGEGYRDLRLRLPDLDEMTGKISISMGLLAENCWKSIASQSSPRSVWLTAWDRITCSKTAYKLAELNVPVMSYGSGQITIAVHQSQYQFVFDNCIKLGLTPPLNMLSHMDAA